MSIPKDGFLSPAIREFSEKIVADFADWFVLSKSLNQTGQRLHATIAIRSDDESEHVKWAASLLFTRSLSTYQGALKLLAASMIVEARILTRSCLEIAAYLAAISKEGAPFVSRMVSEETDSRRRYANGALRSSSLQEFISDHVKGQLESFLQETATEPTEKFDVFNAMRSANIDGLYVFYRELSSDAGHPTLRSLERYYSDKEAASRHEFMWGPRVGQEEVVPTFTMLICAMLLACNSTQEILGSADITPLLEDHFQSWKSLQEQDRR